MKLLVASAFAICLGLAAVTASKAMPLDPLDQAASAEIIRVAGGCGPGRRGCGSRRCLTPPISVRVAICADDPV